MQPKYTTYMPNISAYDPKTRAAGSVDPLGALTAYGALADGLMPGLTTVTFRARYLSMICSALYWLEKAEKAGKVTVPAGPTGITFRRRAVEPFERLWALACARDGKDTSGIKGIRSASKQAEKINTEEYTTPEYKLLKSQNRNAGVARLISYEA